MLFTRYTPWTDFSWSVVVSSRAELAMSSQASCPLSPKGILEKTAGWAQGLTSFTKTA